MRRGNRDIPDRGKLRRFGMGDGTSRQIVGAGSAGVSVS